MKERKVKEGTRMWAKGDEWKGERMEESRERRDRRKGMGKREGVGEI